MRKQMKLKRRCCALCKPHKRGWANRWTPEEQTMIGEFDKIKRDPWSTMVQETDPPPPRRLWYCM